MVKVELNLLNIFHLRIKKSSIIYEGNTVGDIITKFVEEYKDNLDNALLSSNKKKLDKKMVIILNGRNIEYLNKYKTELKEGDKLHVSVPLAGG